MSASSKKKLRAEENAAKLTEKQLNERKEAKKLRIYTIAFGIVLVMMIAAFIWISVSKTISKTATPTATPPRPTCSTATTALTA